MTQALPSSPVTHTRLRSDPDGSSPVHERGLQRKARLGETRDIWLHASPICGSGHVGDLDCGTPGGTGLPALYVAPQTVPASWHPSREDDANRRTPGRSSLPWGGCAC
jgi:hypothetical protein